MVGVHGIYQRYLTYNVAILLLKKNCTFACPRQDILYGWHCRMILVFYAKQACKSTTSGAVIGMS